MASVSSYTFDNMTRIGQDSCDMSQDNIQNAKGGSYMLTNYFTKYCGMKKPIEFATSQPNVFYSGSHLVGMDGCNIDANSDLSIGTIQTHPKCRISLYQRPFATVPYLGRGPSNVILESKLQQGDMITNKKSVNTTTEISYMPYSNYPLIPSLQATVTNPTNLVEGAAAEGWIRGGLPSRELTRDKDYFMQHTVHQY